MTQIKRMKSNAMKRTLLLSCLTAVGLNLQAGPLLRSDVPAEPIWVAHLDCDALRPTAVGQYVLSEMEKPEAQGKLGAFQAMFSFDLRTQLHSLTLYSTGEAPEK